VEGLQWKVGNGRQIRIWEDKWLPDVDQTTSLTFQSFI
jgi:hypothetical protein